MTTICRKPIERYMARTFLGVAVFFSGSQAFAQRGPSFQGLGTVAAPGFEPLTRATGVSSDGLVVIGVGEEEHGLEAPFRWTRASGFFILPSINQAAYSVPHAASGDGSVVVGVTGLRSNAGDRAFRWSSSSGTISLGDLPGGGADSYAAGVSADGSVIVGISESASGAEAVRWTQTGGMIGLGFLPGLTSSSTAGDVSADGSVVVGFSSAGIGAEPASEAFRWTADEGLVGLGELPGGSFQSRATAVSADGSVVVGEGCNSNNDTEAFRWTATGGMVGLGHLFVGSFLRSMPLGVSADGSVIVGWTDSLNILSVAFIWDAVNGMRDLKGVLENELGLDLTGWWLDSAEGVSGDGRVIVGTAFNRNGRREAWIAVLSECGTDTDCSDGLFCNGVETCVSNVCTPGTPPCEAGDPCLESAGVCTSSIPTVSQWGLIAMTLLLVTATTCILKQRTVPER